MVIGLTKRNAHPLLRTVRGEKHASDDDHEGPAQKKRRASNGKLARKQREAGINAEPQSSSDEQIRQPPPPRASDSLRILSTTTWQEDEDINAEPQSSGDEPMRLPQPKKAKASIPNLPTLSSQDDTGSTTSQRKASKKAPAIRRPVAGSFQKGRAEKAKRGISEDKENASLAVPPSSAGSVNEGGFQWGMEHASQRTSSQKSAKGYGAKSKIANIHMPLPKKANNKPSPKATSRPTYGKGKSRDNSVKRAEAEDSDSDVSMKSHKPLDNDELDGLLGSQTKVPESHANVIRSKVKQSTETTPILPLDDDELRTVNVRPKKAKFGGKFEPLPLNDDELDDTLKRPRLLDQLDDWMQDQAPQSSQPALSAPHEAFDNLHDYIEQLPKEAIEGTQCTLCRETVDMEDYWDFWKGKDKTVKNHTAFCHAHKRRTAQEQYREEGFPDINWDALLGRIRKCRTDLFQILNNERTSVFRDRYEPSALTGKAATVPSRRKDLSKEIQEELEANAFDDQSTYPGYYGPHGRRLITENVMKVLKNEIKSCKDRVVQASGPATFIQAVLVPEMAVLLIMEDCKVSREKAEDIREQTYDMGLLLNEEIEDELDIQFDSEDENEYHR